MAQSTLNNFFPTVKKNSNFFIFPKENKMFFQTEKTKENNQKKTLFDFFQMEKKENSLEKTPEVQKEKPLKPMSDFSKSPFKTNLLIKWLKKDQKTDLSPWSALPKDLVLRIMQFLTIKDNAKLACVNKYYQKCFNSIWFSYDFLGKFNFNTFTTAKEIKKVFEKSSRMCHIRKMKSILIGKKLEAFIKRTKLSTTLAKNRQKKGNLFEEFSIEPRTKGLALFITDKEVVDICESSQYSLMFISLVSCQLITDKSFESICKCSNLQNLSICKNK